MKIKNVGKKIIGNKDFHLLPGEVMEVTGTEEWVKMYIGYGNLEEVAEPKAESVPEVETAPEVETTPEAEAVVEAQEVKKNTAKKAAATK